MLDAPFAALASEAKPVENALSPPCVKAVYRPSAAGPVASGPTGLVVAVCTAVGATGWLVRWGQRSSRQSWCGQKT